MRAFFWILVLAGCHASNAPTDDGAVGSDSSTACGRPPLSGCDRPEGFHVCSDVSEQPICMDGAWVCPPGTGAGDCWCYGYAPDCGCTPRGYACPPPACPADPIAAEGTECFAEGQSCDCADPCGACSALQCVERRWTRVEVPASPDACDSFDCGPDARCVRGEEYCVHSFPRTPSGSERYWCAELAPSCPAADCTCFTGDGWMCTDDDGALRLEVR